MDDESDVEYQCCYPEQVGIVCATLCAVEELDHAVKSENTQQAYNDSPRAN